MKTNYFLVTLVLVAMVLLAGCGSQARVGPLRTES
jgi:outer membrane murein-binding lipoprotein Lpp